MLDQLTLPVSALRSKHTHLKDFNILLILLKKTIKMQITSEVKMNLHTHTIKTNPV